MDESRLNTIMRLAIQTVETGEWCTADMFEDDEEIKAYVQMVTEMEKHKGQKVVWMPE